MNEGCGNIHGASFCATGFSGPVASTLTPARRRYWPLTTTRSPACKPLVTTLTASSLGPTEIGRFSAVSSAPITQANGPWELRCTTAERDGHDVLQCVGEHAHPNELTGPEPCVLVGKGRLQPDRARRLVDLIVDQEQRARGKFMRVVLVEGEDGDAPFQHGFAHRSEIALRQGEDGHGRLDLREHRNRHLIGGMDDVAGIDLAEADIAVDGGDDRRVAELSLGAFDRGLVGQDGCLEVVDLGLLLIDRLLRARTLDHQRREAVEVLLVGHQLGFVLDPLCLGLIDHRLVRPRIDHGEHVAFVDLLAFDEVDALQLAVDLRADGDGIDGLHRTQSVEVDGHVARRGFHHGDGHRRGLGSLRLPSARRVSLWRHALEHERAAQRQGGYADDPRHGRPARPALAGRLVGRIELRRWRLLQGLGRIVKVLIDGEPLHASERWRLKRAPSIAPRQ